MLSQESRGRLIIGRLCTFLDAQMLFELVALSVKKRSSLAYENSDCCPSLSSTKPTMGVARPPSNSGKKESKSKRRSVSLPPSSSTPPTDSDSESEDIDPSGSGGHARKTRLEVSQHQHFSPASSSGSILENGTTTGKKPRVRGDGSSASQETDEKKERQRREQPRSTLVASADELLFIHQTIQVFNWVLLSAQVGQPTRKQRRRRRRKRQTRTTRKRVDLGDDDGCYLVSVMGEETGRPWTSSQMACASRRLR